MPLPTVIHIFHRVFNIHLSLVFQWVCLFLEKYVTRLNRSFPKTKFHHLFYITFYLPKLSPFIFQISSGQVCFCRILTPTLQKKQVYFLYMQFSIHFICKNGCLSGSRFFRFIPQYPGLRRRSNPCPPCCLPGTHSSPGRRSWRRCRRTAAAGADTAYIPGRHRPAPDPPG